MLIQTLLKNTTFHFEHWRLKYFHRSFYIVYNLFRAAAIVQGVYKRGLDGNASSEIAVTLGEECKKHAHKAWQMVEKNGSQ